MLVPARICAWGLSMRGLRLPGRRPQTRVAADQASRASRRASIRSIAPAGGGSSAVRRRPSDPARAQPFLFKAGDRVRFRRWMTSSRDASRAQGDAGPSHSPRRFSHHCAGCWTLLSGVGVPVAGAMDYSHARPTVLSPTRRRRDPGSHLSGLRSSSRLRLVAVAEPTSRPRSIAVVQPWPIRLGAARD